MPGRQASENPYDAVPYGGYTHPQTHTERLCAIGRLFGVDAAAPETARVLELGCARGANLLPMAYHLPQARFVGIDLSARQIEAGRAEVAALGLDNLELRHSSILDFVPEPGAFDYIVCHGVYSWVSADIRDKILEICRAGLAPHGVALVSYNTLPGWSMVRGLRDMMLYHVRELDDPLEKAEQARSLLRFLRDGNASAKTPYARFLDSELARLARTDDSYLLHDHLEEINRAFYFHDFVAAARGHALDYLGESDLGSMLVDNLPPEIAGKLREIGDIVRMEQYMDFVRNRRFRSTLLCQGERRLRRDLAAEDVKDLLLSCTFEPDLEITPETLADGVEVAFREGSSWVKTNGRIAKAALAVLCSARGRPLAYPELVAATAELAGETDLEAVEAAVDQELNPCRLIFIDVVDVHARPRRHATAVGERPQVTALARHQARAGERVANLRHQSIVLGTAERVLIQYLDGEHDLAAMREAMREHFRNGDLELVVEGERIEDEERFDEAAGTACETILGKFAESALLVGPPG